MRPRAWETPCGPRSRAGFVCTSRCCWARSSSVSRRSLWWSFQNETGQSAMDFLKHWLLTILIFLPMAGALLVLFMRTRDGVRWATLGTTLLTFILSMLLFVSYKWNTGNAYAYEENGGVVQMVQHARWIP